MAWVMLLVAGLFEVGMVTGLKLSAGFTRAGPSVLFGVSGLLSFLLLAQAMKTIPAGTAYAVWTGIGSAGAVALGIAAFGEPATAARLGALTMIVGGVVLLRLVSGE